MFERTKQGRMYDQTIKVMYDSKKEWMHCRDNELNKWFHGWRQTCAVLGRTGRYPENSCDSVRVQHPGQQGVVQIHEVLLVDDYHLDPPLCHTVSTAQLACTTNLKSQYVPMQHTMTSFFSSSYNVLLLNKF